MKTNRKKIVAREFLILICCLFIGLIAFTFIYPYNYFKTSKIENLNNEIAIIEKQIDSVQKPIENKIAEQKRMYSEWMNNDEVSQTLYSDYRELWQRLEYVHKADSINYKWNNVWVEPVIKHLKKFGFEKPKELNDFVAKNSIKQNDDNIKLQSKHYEDNLSELNKSYREKERNIFDFDEQMNFSFLILIIVGIIAFPLRYLLYAIKWSLRILKDDKG